EVLIEPRWFGKRADHSGRQDLVFGSDQHCVFSFLARSLDVARIRESLVFFQAIRMAPSNHSSASFQGAPHSPQNFIPLAFSKLQAGQRMILGPTAEAPRVDSLE